MKNAVSKKILGYSYKTLHPKVTIGGFTNNNQNRGSPPQGGVKKEETEATKGETKLRKLTTCILNKNQLLIPVTINLCPIKPYIIIKESYT